MKIFFANSAEFLDPIKTLELPLVYAFNASERPDRYEIRDQVFSDLDKGWHQESFYLIPDRDGSSAKLLSNYWIDRRSGSGRRGRDVEDRDTLSMVPFAGTPAPAKAISGTNFEARWVEVESLAPFDEQTMKDSFMVIIADNGGVSAKVYGNVKIERRQKKNILLLVAYLKAENLLETEGKHKVLPWRLADQDVASAFARL